MINIVLPTRFFVFSVLFYHLQPPIIWLHPANNKYPPTLSFSLQNWCFSELLRHFLQCSLYTTIISYSLFYENRFCAQYVRNLKLQTTTESTIFTLFLNSLSSILLVQKPTLSQHTNCHTHFIASYDEWWGSSDGQYCFPLLLTLNNAAGQFHLHHTMETYHSFPSIAHCTPWLPSELSQAWTAVVCRNGNSQTKFY